MRICRRWQRLDCILANAKTHYPQTYIREIQSSRLVYSCWTVVFYPADESLRIGMLQPLFGLAYFVNEMEF